MAHQAESNRPLDEMMLLDPEILKCPYHYDRMLRAQAQVG